MIVATLRVDFRVQTGAFSLNVCFQAPGGTAAILGASGSGKTLTLRTIAGLMRPWAGTVVLGDRTLADSERGVWVPTRHRRVGYVFQEYALFPHLSVGENMSYGLAAQPKANAQRRVAELITLLQLEGLEDRRPHQLSGGQQQRVALGRALAPAPQLLLLDEPFSALDSPTRAALIDQFQALQQQLGFTTLLVTHDVAEAYALSSHLVVLDQGRVIQEGPREEVFHQPRSPEAARLLGVRNLLPGRVLGADADATWVEVSGVRLQAGHASAGHAPLPTSRPPAGQDTLPKRNAALDSGGPLLSGTQVTVGIRPEEIVARPGLDSGMIGIDNLVSGTLVRATDRGTRRLLLLSLRGNEGTGPQILVETSQIAAPLSTEWTVTIPPAAVHVWRRE